jgi:flagellar hook-basal body complex protein FliE
MTAPPIQAVAAFNAIDRAQIQPLPPALLQTAAPSGVSFSQMLLNGVEQVDRKLIEADSMATAFTLDDSIPLHQVTYALEQARLSFELMNQVRSRLIEGYQELLRMQL